MEVLYTFKLILVVLHFMMVLFLLQVLQAASARLSDPADGFRALQGHGGALQDDDHLQHWRSSLRPYHVCSRGIHPSKRFGILGLLCSSAQVLC